MTQWIDLFTTRQNVALEKLARLTANLPTSLQQTMIGLLIDKMADGNNSLSAWESAVENTKPLFVRQAIPLVWDFCESTPASSARGAFLSGVNAACKVVDGMVMAASGSTQQADATEHPLPSESASIWFTDPPYYDAIPYADLSDFFLVWLKRSVPNHPLVKNHLNPSKPLSPKSREVVQDNTKLNEGQPKTSTWFEEKMASAFAEGRRVLSDECIGSVVFAHKTTEGWEALLSGMIGGGWTITGSWPIATEQPNRMRAHGSAALATSVHLVCRPRGVDTVVGDWGEVLGEVPGRRVGDWMERLQGEGVRGTDLVFACVGPALEIFSRYPRVETAAGEVVELGEYLEKVWEVVGRAALEQVLGTEEARARNGGAGALEEDARLTALFLWTLQSGSDVAATDANGGRAGDESDDAADAAATPAGRGYRLQYDVTRRFAQPLGIHLDEWKSRVIGIDKGVVRLLPVTKRGKQLFGAAGASRLADEFESGTAASTQLSLFPDPAPSRPRRGRNPAPSGQPNSATPARDATTLDRVHAAMLFQHSGRSQALRAIIQQEQERGPDFLRLANALSALYPRGSQEKRLLDAMLLTVPR